MSAAVNSVVLRPSWGRAVLAVITGWWIALFLNLLWLLPLGGLGVPFAWGRDGGHGWPWRIEGAWSLAADVGPLLLASTAFAFGAGLVLAKDWGLQAPRLALIAASTLVGWVAVSTMADPGLLPVNGLVAFTGLVAVARWSAWRPRLRLRWTPALVVAAVLAGVALAATSVSYGLLHPLRAAVNSGDPVFTDGHARLEIGLLNEGRLDVQLLAVELPGLGVNESLDGARIVGDGFGSAYVTVAAEEPCVERTVDRVRVRMRVGGVGSTQVLSLEEPVRIAC
jgi:hypothetical protein